MSAAVDQIIWGRCALLKSSAVIIHQVNHFANTPMYYTAIFRGCKNDNFQMKNADSFLIFAQNIDRGYRTH